MTTRPRLFALEMSAGGRVFSVNLDGTDKRILVDGCRLPDGIAVDVAHGHLYWTNMGNPSANDGSIERADLDGTNRVTIVPSGATFTPKQLQLEPLSRKLYWSDREGMRVMRCDLDGSNLETLVQTGKGELDRRDQTRWCVGIAVDVGAGRIYWTQKGPSDGGRGQILRAAIDVPDGETAATRRDVEMLYDALPEPIDLELDIATSTMYWTDRGDPPRGNTVNRAPFEARNGHREPPEILVTHLMEGIGLALDLNGKRMFMTDLAGTLYAADLDGANRRELLDVQGNLTGIAYVELPA
ncbi:hypothetical protein OM076_06610 [Solirubrobacter ginsenosidimutans]|uniref:3-hydroxyacyl-CoA dehydrogenase n=1 Tax=Solirubrobacter ginsenosidimutans TaxID=490573 RepID=A0A9X3MPI5_9ACTN|nr:hypothetical protein [Solirubrobacter ginsenosidimutans]MDA0159925.1 hypothetical protein [Solirubrobacter ginsenosidimutans]